MNAFAAAVAAFRAGDLEETRRLAESIPPDDPAWARARTLIGLTAQREGDLAGALGQFGAALERQPSDPDLLRADLAAAGAAGQDDRVRLRLERLVELGLASARERAKLAELQALVGRVDAARRTIAAIAELEGQPPEVLSIAAFVAERCNDDAQAVALARRAAEGDPGDFRARFVIGRVLDKQGDAAAAGKAFDAALALAGTPVNRSLVLGQLGRLADRRGDHATAFDSYRAANDALRPLARRFVGTSVYGPAMLDELRSFLTAERLAGWESPREVDHDEPPPVFLVGFPRSGTTLLDRVLEAHTSVHVLEEKDTLGPLLSRYAGRPGALVALDDVDDAQRREARAIYRERLQAEGASPGRLAVDKLPLNSMHLALIHRLLPDARIILALRDPRDVCLSCFFQSFGLNEAMSQFLDWEQTARYYDAVMTVTQRALGALPIRHAVVRYEDLTSDLERALAPVLELLGLGWEDAMGRFADRARSAAIDTPSYDQVVRPLYRSSVARWRHYAEQVALIDPVLGPWLERFGYTT